MIGCCAFVFVVSMKSQAVRLGDIPDSLVGVYDNRSLDVRLVISRCAYRIESGRPTSLPVKRRHVDYEYGNVSLRNRDLLFRRAFLFKSPSRSTYYDLFGWGKFEGYQREFPNAADQRRLAKELHWRVSTRLSLHKAHVRMVGGLPQIVVDGTVLDKDNSLRHLVDALPNSR